MIDFRWNAPVATGSPPKSGEDLDLAVHGLAVISRLKLRGCTPDENDCLAVELLNGSDRTASACRLKVVGS